MKTSVLLLSKYVYNKEKIINASTDVSNNVTVWHFYTSYYGMVILEMSKHYLCNAKIFTVALCQKHVNYYNNMDYTHTHTHAEYMQYTLTFYKQKASKKPIFPLFKRYLFWWKKVTLLIQVDHKIIYNFVLLNVPKRLNVKLILFKGIGLKETLKLPPGEQCPVGLLL